MRARGVEAGGMRLRRVLLSAAIAGALVICIVAFQTTQTRDAPPVTFTPLVGPPVSLPSLRGKVVLVSFWATSCTACLTEMPMMIDLHRTYAPRGLELVAVAMPYDAPWLVADYATRTRLPFRVTFDPHGDAVNAFGGVSGTPTAFLIDKRGRIVRKIEGAPDFTQLRKQIEELVTL
jgi:thiol-disulfide isomerase/thioredoxin